MDNSSDTQASKRRQPKLVCEHPDLLEMTITMRDLGTNKRAQAVELQPSC